LPAPLKLWPVSLNIFLQYLPFEKVFIEKGVLFCTGGFFGFGEKA
jgi:hypothetical protein